MATLRPSGFAEPERVRTRGRGDYSEASPPLLAVFFPVLYNTAYDNRPLSYVVEVVDLCRKLRAP